MAFRCFTLFIVIGLAAAAEYDYNDPNFQMNVAVNSAAEDVNSFSAVTTIEDSEATPLGYDYTPRLHAAAVTTGVAETTRAITGIAAGAKVPAEIAAPVTSTHAHIGQHNQIPIAPPVVHWPPAKYEYSYNVHDAYTGDIKSHTESRDGYFVRGSYSVVDPDGYERVVTYTADDVNGFNAVVSRKPIANAIVKTTPAVELHQQQQQQQQQTPLSMVAQVKESMYAEPTVQPHDSYASSPPHQDSNGPYL